jgi:hypothetical protein
MLYFCLPRDMLYFCLPRDMLYFCLPRDMLYLFLGTAEAGYDDKSQSRGQIKRDKIKKLKVSFKQISGVRFKKLKVSL